MSTKAKPPDITAELAETLRKANLSNLVKKVKAGKTLTAAEMKQIAEASKSDESPQLVTVKRLSELFGVATKTIGQWRRDGREGVPEKVGAKEDLSAWRAWFSSNPSAGHSDGKPRKDRESLLCEKLEIEIKLKLIELETEEGSLVRAATVQEDVNRAVSSARGELLKLSADLPPRLDGLSPPRMQVVIREAIIDVLTRLSDETSSLYQCPDQ